MQAREFPRGDAPASPFETRRFAAFLRVRIYICECASSSLKVLAFHSGFSQLFTLEKISF